MTTLAEHELMSDDLATVDPDQFVADWLAAYEMSHLGTATTPPDWRSIVHDGGDPEQIAHWLGDWQELVPTQELGVYPYTPPNPW